MKFILILCCFICVLCNAAHQYTLDFSNSTLVINEDIQSIELEVGLSTIKGNSVLRYSVTDSEGNCKLDSNVFRKHDNIIIKNVKAGDKIQFHSFIKNDWFGKVGELFELDNKFMIDFGGNGNSDKVYVSAIVVTPNKQPTGQPLQSMTITLLFLLALLSPVYYRLRKFRKQNGVTCDSI